MAGRNQQRVLFNDLFEKTAAVEFTAPDQCSDGGVLLLRAMDEKMGLADSMAGALRDPRQPGKVRHSLQEMMRERVLGIGCGYPDANDAARLTRDPAIRLCCDRRDESLGSQPTLSRFENAARSTDRMRMGTAFTDRVIAHEQAKRRRVAASRGTQTVFAEGRYRAGKWKRDRRVIIKAEVAALAGREPRDNPRFLITNLPWKPKKGYRFYALRGDAENRIKELKDGLRFDLTSCARFRANQFRILLTAATYALCQQLRYEARGTACERAQVWTLRERLLKLAVVIRETARRIWIEAPKTYAWLTTWRAVAERLGANVLACRAGP